MLWLFGLVLAVAVLTKVSNNKAGACRAEVAKSPLSEAIGQLVAVSGGIYIALELLCSFLGLAADWQISIEGAKVDALAMLALVLACLQPIGIYLVRKVRQIGKI